MQNYSGVRHVNNCVSNNQFPDGFRYAKLNYKIFINENVSINITENKNKVVVIENNLKKEIVLSNIFHNTHSELNFAILMGNFCKLYPKEQNPIP